MLTWPPDPLSYRWEAEAPRKACSTAWVCYLLMLVVHSKQATESPHPGDHSTPMYVPQGGGGGDKGKRGQSSPEELLSSQAPVPASISKVLLLGEKASIRQLPALPVQVSRGLGGDMEERAEFCS